MNTFERMEIADTIYEGVVEPYYWKTTQVDANYFGNRSKIRGGYSQSKKY